VIEKYGLEARQIQGTTLATLVENAVEFVSDDALMREEE
jgi:hypothetical protein